MLEWGFRRCGRNEPGRHQFNRRNSWQCAKHVKLCSDILPVQNGEVLVDVVSSRLILTGADPHFYISSIPSVSVPQYTTNKCASQYIISECASLHLSTPTINEGASVSVSMSVPQYSSVLMSVPQYKISECASVHHQGMYECASAHHQGLCLSTKSMTVPQYKINKCASVQNQWTCLCTRSMNVPWYKINDCALVQNQWLCLSTKSTGLGPPPREVPNMHS